MSDSSAANAIRKELNWPKRDALVFVRLIKNEAFKHAKHSNISLKEALVRLARVKGRVSAPPISEMGDE